MGKKSYFVLALVPLFLSHASQAWIPKTFTDLTLTEDCRPEFLEDGLLAKKGNMPAIEQFTNEYFSRCEFQLRRRSDSTWLTMLSMSKLEYEFDKRSGIKKVEFIDHRDEVVRPAYLGLQPGNRPRPLIVFQCGVLCNLGDASMKTLFMGLYDTGVFHVLALPSSTGSDYQKRNGILALGGIDEGRQIMRIALMLRGPDFPYASKISDIHLIGASLGGHSALYASLYADHYQRLTKKKPFDSVMAACPVVRLQPSIENITRGSIIGRIFYSNFVSQIKDVFASTPILRSLIPVGQSFRPKYAELRNIIANGALDYYKNRTRDPTWGLAPLQDTRIATIEDLWHTNDFVSYAYEKKINPLFLWTSSDDPVVYYEDNSKVLINRDKDSKDQKIFSVVTPRGNHCMYEASYGWQTTGALFRGYFLSGSPAYSRSRRRSRLPISPSRLPYGYTTKVWEKRTTIAWKVDPKTKSISLVSEFLRDDCFPNGRVHNTICRRESSLDFNYKELGIDTVPENREDVLALERRLNTNYRIYGPNDHYLSQTDTPESVEMLNY